MTWGLQGTPTLTPQSVGDECPGCKAGSNRHVGGTCYGDGSPWSDGHPSHLCGWVNLGRGNTWDQPPGWYRGQDLNAVGHPRVILWTTGEQ